MAEHKVVVEKLTVQEHPDADRLEIAQVGDYQSIIMKGQYETGDLAAYIPEASLVPDPLIQEMGLEGKLAGSKQNRVKAVRLRGVLSQGLCYPAREEWEEGQDVTEELGVTKYEPVIPASMDGVVYAAGGRRCLKYDIENFKRYPEVLEEGEEVVITEKIHGCADKDTEIETLEHGTLTISEIVENKIPCHVKSMNVKTGDISFESVEGYSQDPNEGDWYELEMEDAVVVLTGNHPVWLPELKCYRRVDQLKGDEICLLDRD
jgi:tRNA-binding EMAP/Myf-like protein